MRFKRVVIVSNLIFLISVSAFGQNNKAETIKEVVSAGNKAVIEGDWASAESKFREAVNLEPKNSLWHIQLTLALGQQKKWKDAFKEFDKVMDLGAMDWVLSINKKTPDGNLAFVNTDIFDEEKTRIEG